MAKIIYLFGAGASRGIRTTDKAPNDSSTNKIVEGMPVVNEINKRLEFFHSEIIFFYNHGCNDLSNDKKNNIKQILEGIIWLRNNALKHVTIDTFAKKLFLTKDIESYPKIKSVLSLYFFMEQIVNPPDSRYDTFYANLLTSDLKLPDDIKILSWNYDNQFELMYKEYDKSLKFDSIRKNLGICDMRTENIIQNPSIFKLNGTAGFKSMLDPSYFSTKWNDKIGIDKIKNKETIESLAKLYCYDSTSLSFAWDDNKTNNFDIVLKNIKDAEALVIIGYSFPFFNISIDRSIFREMKNLRHIYIQDPNAEKINDRLRPFKTIMEQNGHSDINNIKIEIIKDCSQFCIPDEL